MRKISALNTKLLAAVPFGQQDKVKVLSLTGLLSFLRELAVPTETAQKKRGKSGGQRLNFTEACEFFGVGASTLYRWIREGRMPFYRPGREYHFAHGEEVNVTVRKRKDTGKWVCDFYYNGERIVRTLKFTRTKKEAEVAEAVIMNEVFKQAYGFETKPDRRFEDFVVETFLPYSEANKKSFYCDVLICRVLVEKFKGKTLRQITPPLIEAFKQEFLNTPTKHGNKRSPTTVNYHLSVLSKIFSLAVDSEFVESNPCFRVKKLKLNNQRTRVLSDEEEEKLFSALGDNELVKQIVTVALHTRMRRGEIFNLKWFDVDFNRSLVQVRESKSGKKRFVPMNTTVMTMLENLKRKSEFVFPSPKTEGKLNNIRRSFRRAVQKAGINDFCFHDLRHTAATRMADAGADAFTLMRILGHSDIRMTTRYTHATDSAIRRAVEKLDGNSDFGNVLVTKQKRRVSHSP